MAEAHSPASSPWQQLFPVKLLLRAMRQAVGIKSLVLASVAMVLTAAGWNLCGWIFQIDPEAAWNLHVPSTPATWPWQQNRPTSVTLEMGNWAAIGIQADHPITRPWWHLTRPLRRAFNSYLSFADVAYLFVAGVWTVAVWAFFGGAIARGTAVALARHENLGWGHVLKFARAKWPSLAGAPLLTLLGISGLAIPLAILGLLARTSFGMLLAGVLWPLALLAGVAMTVLAMGLLFGWPLMWSTIGAEGTDAFDAISRSYAYVYHRPIQYLFYALQALLLGLAGWFLVDLFAAVVLQLTSWGIALGYGKMNILDYVSVAQEEIPPGMESAGASLIRFWTNVVWTIAAAFAYSYLFTASTAIYFVLRKQIDDTEMDEVYLTEENEAYGLPPLDSDSMGVPTVSDGPASASAKPAKQSESTTEG